MCFIACETKKIHREKMEVAPSYVSKTKLLKKIERRAAERAKRIQIDKNVDTLDKTLLGFQTDGLARFADRHQCTLRFVPDTKGSGTVVKVYKDKHVLYRQPDIMGDFNNMNCPPITYVEHMYKGSAEIPDNRIRTTDKMYAKSLRQIINDILNPKNCLDKRV